MNQPLYKELSTKVLGMAFKIHNALGPGLLEHCYEEAFCVELKYAGIPFERQWKRQPEFTPLRKIIFTPTWKIEFTPRWKIIFTVLKRLVPPFLFEFCTILLAD